MSGGRPTLSLTRKTPIKSRKNLGASSSSGKKKSESSGSGSKQQWVDSCTDLNQYKLSNEDLEQRRIARKSNNKVLAKVALSDKRVQLLNPEKQRLIEKQLLAENRKHPNQNVEAILARSEQVMGICQGILSGQTITPSYAGQDMADLGLRAGEQAAAGQCDTSTDSEPLSPERGEAMASEQASSPSQATVTPYMNCAALNEIAGELLVTVRELREELLQEREARERLEREVVQQRELLAELAKEVVRLQIFCSVSSNETDTDSLATKLNNAKMSK